MTTPWISSETKRVSVSKQSKFIVSKKFLGELVDKELSKITQDLKEKFETEREVIEKLIAEVSIDDEPTDNPINEECQFLDLYLSYSHTNKNFVTKSKEALESVFHSTPVSFSSFSILTYLMIRDSYVNQRESYLILDIAGETTDLSVVNRGIFGEKYSFPSGKKTLLKHLALDLKIEERDALELFRLYYQNNLSLNHREKLKKYFESLERFWSEEFKHYLDTILKYHQLPKFIFLTIDVDMRNWFFEVFKKTELANNLTLDKRFQIIILDQTEMIDKCSLEVGNHDPFIMIEAIALSKK
jgi:cell division ATPase FtsA